MRRRFRTGGLAAWSIRRPVAVLMLALAVVVLGVFSLERLAIELLPHIIYPEVRVRILDPGVPASIMEDQVTRQLEEQLAITENAIAIQSESRLGRSSVDLSFPYGTDIDLALRDASTRLDRAKRFLPDSIEPAIIYKRDPSQIPIMELAVSSTGRDSKALRDWVDYQFSNWFLNLPGVASTEVGGGDVREIQILVDQESLAGLGLTFEDIRNALAKENVEFPGGRILLSERELSTRTTGRITSPEEINALPLRVDAEENESVIRIRDVGRVIDTHEDERLRVRLNGQPAIKLSIQKQPSANTVAVVDAVRTRLAWLQQQHTIPDDIRVAVVADQSIYIRHALRNASLAVISGAVLAMLVVYLFLGDVWRTLIIGLSIPLAILVTFIIMALSELTLNIMTLGGLAVGVGMLVDNTIVMLENMTRHQQLGESGDEASINAASEITSAITASTTTNLAAILPFLFIGGLVGLLFNELIVTLSAAILASLLVALTVVPALGARSSQQALPTLRGLPARVNRWLDWLRERYIHRIGKLLDHPWLPLLLMLALLIGAAGYLGTAKQIFLPGMDEGRVIISVRGDSGIQLDDMDRVVKKIERLLLQSPELESVFTTAGGFIFGRSEFQSSNFSGLYVQLVPASQRTLSSQAWIHRMQKRIQDLQLVGYRVRMHVQGIRRVRLGRGDDDISIRIQGDDLEVLARLGDEVVDRMKKIPGLRNVQHNYEDLREELVVEVDRERAADLGIRPDAMARALQVGLDGLVVSDFIDGDRKYNIRLRLPRRSVSTIDEAANLLVGVHHDSPVRLRDVATMRLDLTPTNIKRDNQRRIVEISASLGKALPLNQALDEVEAQLADLQLPPGYSRYEGGARERLQKGQSTGYLLLGLALFLVFVVLAVQYESLRNPFIILLSIPFTLIGVVAGLLATQTALSMPVWLGLIMLAGIVVNNAIVLLEQIEIEREQGSALREAILRGGRIRLRPILMTTLTTAVGMSPLALGLGEGSEMLQPLAIVMVWGLLFSLLVSLLLVPLIYRLAHGGKA
ncbi:MAG TPA: efflux RND transporter permease subunit [Chromatiales bacterium]|nr:efflux RND transporter permease subunit [Chromatiales bacterium]